MNNNATLGKWIIIIGIIVVFLAIVGSCDDSESDYRKTLESGTKKYYSGESMTKEEYEAVKDFNEWMDDQKDKSYDEWDN